MKTSHDLMRDAMIVHAISAIEIIDYIHSQIGGDRSRIVAAVERFIAGGPGSVAVHAAIIGLSVQQESATVH